MRHQTLRRTLALSALPLAALLLAGCTAAGPTAGPAAGTDTDDLHAWGVKYASCMQAEGIDYPTPHADPDAPMEALDIEALGGMEAFTAADALCAERVGAPPAPTGPDGQPVSDEEMRDAALELTTCLREQGAEVEDPTADGGISIPQDISNAALEACGLSAIGAGE